MRAPLAILFQIVSHMLAQKNVPRVPAIHHSLRQIDSRARHIGAIVHIDNIRPLVRCGFPCAPAAPGGSAALCSISAMHRKLARRGVVAKTNAIPSPVGIGASLPAASAARNESVSLNNLVERMQVIALLVD